MSQHKMLTRARARNNPTTQFFTLPPPPPRAPRPLASWLHQRQPNPYYANPAWWINYRGPPEMSPLSLGPPALRLNDHILDENEVDHVHETHYETNVGTDGWNIIYPAGMASIEEELRSREKRRRILNGRAGSGRGRRITRGRERDERGRFVRKGLETVVTEEEKKEGEETITVMVVNVEELEPKKEQSEEPEAEDDGLGDMYD